MARSRRRRPLEPAELEPIMTLGSIAELCEAIRRCNPTRLAVDASERRRRYLLKAALQSALIERFAPELSVRRTRREDVVGIGRRSGRGDGGHARIGDLSDRARAWVDSELRRNHRH